MEKLRYALIGCGRISLNHIAAALNNKDKVEIAAVCDIVPEHMEKVLSAFHLENTDIKRYTDYQLLLKEIKPDFAAIATESGKHAAIAIDCMEAGTSVLVEKPMALSLSDADRMIETSERKGVVLGICHQNRFNKSIVKIREAMDAGRFGKLFYGTAHIRWNRGRDYYTQAPWRGTWEQDGGALMNQCIHNTDLLRWMMGDEIDEVVAFTDRLAHDYIDAEDLGIGLIRFKNGSYGILEGTTDVYPSNLEETLYIFGEKGTVKAGGKSVNTIEEWRFADNADDSQAIIDMFKETPPNIYGFGHTPLYTNVIEAIQNKSKPLVDALAGRRALELVLAIYKSAAEGKAVKLPLSETSTMDFKGRF